MIFLLEDDPVRVAWFESKFHHNLIVSRTVEAAKEQFRGLKPDMVFLDHDLEMTQPWEYADAQHSGLAFINHVLTNELEYPGLRKAARVVIHSMNPVGAAAIHDALHVSGIQCDLVPYHALMGRLKIT